MSVIPAGTMRRARQEDMESILELLTHYDRPRQYFEPWYLGDPTYRPEQSWLVEKDGELLAHLRIYDRRIGLGGVPLRIAGLGNVVTAREWRGRGLVGKLIRAMLAAISHEPFAYSLLWTHLPELYGRYGWAPIEQELVRARMPPGRPGSISLARFEDEDLPEVMCLYEVSNAGRPGPAIRSPAEWQAQRAWLREDPDGFLTARRPDGALAGYVRSRTGPDGTEILDLGIPIGHFDVGRALLSAVTDRSGAPCGSRSGFLEGYLPPSLRPIFHPDEYAVEEDPGLMGRVINLRNLVKALEPVWLDRLRGSGQEGVLHLETHGDRAELRLSEEQIEMGPGRTAGAVVSLDEREFAHLLFHGFESMPERSRFGAAEASLLATLFPVQDFVIWGADRF